MLALPRQLLDPRVAAPYCSVEDVADIHERGDRVILDLNSNDEEEAGWEDGEPWLPELLPLRAEIADGDLRALYLGWLLCVRSGELDDEEREPPVPPGLKRLSPALTKLAEFLRIDEDLLGAAAQASTGQPPSAPARADLAAWVRTLPDADKTDLLFRLADEGEASARSELLLRFRQSRAAGQSRDTRAGGSRTVGELRAAEAYGETRCRTEAEREARRKAAHFAALAPREEEIWRQVEELIAQQKGGSYAEAVRLLGELRDLAAWQQEMEAFTVRLRDLRTRHARRTAFISRLRDAGLP